MSQSEAAAPDDPRTLPVRPIGAGTVRSVLGDLDRQRIGGAALIHEHISSDLSFRSGPTFLLADPELAVAELQAAARMGVGLVVDSGNSGHSRDPEFLRLCAERSGVTIVASTGHYREGFFPPEVQTQSAEQLAQRMVRDISWGFSGGAVRAGAVRAGAVRAGAVRAGAIGEIGCSAEIPTANEARVLVAAAIAQTQTGAPLLTHTAEGLGWRSQLELLAAAGASLDKVVIGHMDCLDDPRAHRSVIEQGAWLGFDRVGLVASQRDEVRVRMLLDLERTGHLGRVLLSMDIATTERYCRAGAPGYAGVISDFVPRLEAAGLTPAAITQLVYENPWRFLLGDQDAGTWAPVLRHKAG